MPDRFSLDRTWINYDSTDSIRQKALRMMELIPEDVKTILDVGCGNGIITNELSSKWDVTGLDSSASALEYVKSKKIQAYATKIPFENSSFDLVLSSELLEHLKDEDLNKAVQEISRIACKYIIISVPNQEYLDVSSVKCPKCSSIYHAWQHLQSFSKGDIERLFLPEFRLIHYETTGVLIKNWIPALLKMKHNLGQWMHPGETAVCPVCGNTVFPPYKKNIFTKAVNFLNLLLSTRKPYWQILLFEKK